MLLYSKGYLLGLTYTSFISSSQCHERFRGFWQFLAIALSIVPYEVEEKVWQTYSC